MNDNELPIARQNEQKFREALMSKKWIHVNNKIINVDKIVMIKNLITNGSQIELETGEKIQTAIPFSSFKWLTDSGEIDMNAGFCHV